MNHIWMHRNICANVYMRTESLFLDAAQGQHVNINKV